MLPPLTQPPIWARNAWNPQTYGPHGTKSFVSGRGEEPVRPCVHSVSAHRHAGNDRPPISCIRDDVADAKKFHRYRKISSAPVLKYFRLLSLLSLRRHIEGAHWIHIPGSRKVKFDAFRAYRPVILS